MAFKLTKIIGFAPDLPFTTPGVLLDCLAVLPTAKGIGSPPLLTAASSGTLDSATVVGTAQLAKADGTLRRFIGTAAKVWEWDGSTTLTDRSGTAYSASTTQGWSFASFGDVALAANKGNTIQKSTGGAFSDLATAPKASIICNVGPPASPFIMALDYDSGGGRVADGWYCSGISDYTTWNSAAAQSVNGRLLEPSGPFVAAVPFRDGILAWKANAMYRGDYVGSPVVWTWTRIASDIGCCGKNMAVVVNDIAYFCDARGFWVYDGSFPKPMPGYVHDFWSNVIANTYGVGSAITDAHAMKWDQATHNIWINYQTGSNLHSMLFFNTLSEIWTASTASNLKNTAGSDLRSIVTLYPTIFTTHADSKVALGAPGSTSAGTGSSTLPTLNCWLEGDPEQYQTVDRIRPYFINVYWGGSQAPASGTATLASYPESSLITATIGTTVNLDTGNGFKFDTTLSGSFVGFQMTFVGAWQMSHVGVSRTYSGARGKS